MLYGLIGGRSKNMGGGGCCGSNNVCAAHVYFYLVCSYHQANCESLQPCTQGRGAESSRLFPEVGQSSGAENLISIINVNEKAFSLDYYLN